MLYFSMEPVAPKLASQGLRNDGCETVSGHSRIMLGHGRNRPSIGIRVFTVHLFLEVQISWQAQHFVNLHVQISWQAQHFCEPPCADFVAGAALCEPPCADFVAGAALCEPPCADVVAGAALCEPPCADFVAGAALREPPRADFLACAIQNALWRDSEGTKCCIFQWNRWLRSWQVKVCGTTVARRSRVILGSCSGMVGIVPPLGLEFSLVS